jgi:hypothetical protein
MEKGKNAKRTDKGLVFRKSIGKTCAIRKKIRRLSSISEFFVCVWLALELVRGLSCVNRDNRTAHEFSHGGC